MVQKSTRFLQKRFMPVVLITLLIIVLVLVIWVLVQRTTVSPGAQLAIAVDPETISDAAIRSELLQEAVDYMGACSPEQAAQLWAQGVQKRNGAMQYAAMDEALKKSYSEKLNESAPNWVTGMSSPWVQSYDIQLSSQKKDAATAQVILHTETSTGPYEDLNALLELRIEDGFWRISNIDAEEDLSPYLYRTATSIDFLLLQEQ